LTLFSDGVTSKQKDVLRQLM